MLHEQETKLRERESDVERRALLKEIRSWVYLVKKIEDIISQGMLLSKALKRLIKKEEEAMTDKQKLESDTAANNEKQ
jgi:aconitase B